MYYTVSEIAEKLKLEVTTIRKYIREGKLPAYKFGREFRVGEQELNEFLESRSVKKKV